MEYEIVRDLTIQREVISYIRNRGSGNLVLLGKIDDGLLHSLFVINEYVNSSGNKFTTAVKIQLAGQADELVAQVENFVSNDNKWGEKVFSNGAFFANNSRKTVTHVVSSGTDDEELGQFQVSKRGFMERFKRVDINLESKKRGATLLHAVGNPFPTRTEFISLDICVSVSSTAGLYVDLRPLVYSSNGFMQKMMLDFDFYDTYPPFPTTTTPPRQNRPALEGDGWQRKKAASLQSSNSGEQNLKGLLNSSGVTDGIGNNSIIIQNLSLVDFGGRYVKGKS